MKSITRNMLKELVEEKIHVEQSKALKVIQKQVDIFNKRFAKDIQVYKKAQEVTRKIQKKLCAVVADASVRVHFTSYETEEAGFQPLSCCMDYSAQEKIKSLGRHLYLTAQMSDDVELKKLIKEFMDASV